MIQYVALDVTVIIRSEQRPFQKRYGTAKIADMLRNKNSGKRNAGHDMQDTMSLN